ncbi:MAG TPA: energy transducer TonB [Steroidobacteraceae bacterium]|nr:energy transducer TonB [Steroidobacteraceae bacterium]
MRSTMLGGAFAAAALAATAAQADFNAALADYKAGHYDIARSQFSAMAELGDCSSQFNLGVMVLQGQGGAKDVGTGIGWLEAAAANGCQELVGGRVAALKGSLSAPEERTAADIMARYGHEALHAQGIVDPELDCRARLAATVLEAPTPEYPRSGNRRNGLVIGELTIGVDGHARDPEILLAAPDDAFAAPAVEAWLHARFTPATRDGAPVESRQQVRLPFAIAGGEVLWSSARYKEARAAADAGDPAAEYLVGLAATADPALGVGAARGTQLVINAARDGNREAQYWLGEQLRSVAACHPKTSGAAWLKHAAAGGDAGAQLQLAADLLSASPSDAQLNEARTLLEHAAAADSYYVRKHVVGLLAASPFVTLRDPATARQLALKLSAGPIQCDPQMFEALAAAAAAAGDFASAVSQQETAIRKARDLAWKTRAMEARLASYKGGKAWQGDVFAL